MQTIPQINPLVNPLVKLLTDAAAKFGVDLAALEANLRTEIIFRNAYGPINASTLLATVAGHEIQLQVGRGAGCLTCARQIETERGYAPGSVARLPTCPAAAAAAVRWVINRNWSRYGADFETWLTGPAEVAPAEADPAEVETIKPASPAAEIADGLRAIYPELSSRIDKALAMVENGQTSEYQTEWDNAGKDGCWSCDCPDAIYRNHRAHFGVACYHAIAGHIRQELDRRAAAIRSREVEKRQARAIARNDYARPGDFTPKADPLNTTAYRPNFARTVRYGSR